MADTHQNTAAYPDATANTAPVAEDTYVNGESVTVRRQVIRAQTVDGDNATLGTKSDSAATNTTGSWSIQALLRLLINAVEQAAMIRSGVSGAATLTASADNSYTFSVQTPLFYVQNNSATPIYLNFDAAASLGSTVIAASGGLIWFQIPTSVVHIWGTAATSVNGATANGIVIVGYH